MGLKTQTNKEKKVILSGGNQTQLGPAGVVVVNLAGEDVNSGGNLNRVTLSAAGSARPRRLRARTHGPTQ